MKFSESLNYKVHISRTFCTKRLKKSSSWTTETWFIR